MKNNVYQIFYSDDTRLALDPGFLPLDNSGQRPDWYEYGAIRHFFRTREIDPNTRYGFLSPRFAQKTRLNSATVMEFASASPDDVDVITFSPYFDQAAFFTNVFEHASACHPEIGPAQNGVLSLLAPGMDIGSLVMSSVQTVYCNFLIATPAFWREWLRLCEVIYNVAEDGTTELARQLNADVKYEQTRAPAKIFLIERVVSLILATQRTWKVRNFNPMTLPIANERLGRFGTELAAMDALKRAANETGFGHYVAAFLNLRNQVNSQLQAAAAGHAR